jgi:hypothetical protein
LTWLDEESEPEEPVTRILLANLTALTAVEENRHLRNKLELFFPLSISLSAAIECDCSDKILFDLYTVNKFIW